jgi:hypothetical protein
MQGASSKEIVMKEIVMLRKTMVVLATTLVLGGSALSSSAFARGGDYGGGGGPGGGGFRGNHFAGAFRGDRTVGDGYSGYRGRVSDLRDRFNGYRRGDVWGHWGTYYGPMISVP